MELLCVQPLRGEYSTHFLLFVSSVELKLFIRGRDYAPIQLPRRGVPNRMELDKIRKKSLLALYCLRRVAVAAILIVPYSDKTPPKTVNLDAFLQFQLVLSLLYQQACLPQQQQSLHPYWYQRQQRRLHLFKIGTHSRFAILAPCTVEEMVWKSIKKGG